MHFFLKEGAVPAVGREVFLDPEDVNHACRVLRLQKGSPVTVSDGRGAAFRGVVSCIGPREVQVELVEPVRAAEPRLQVTLLQGLAKGEKMDRVLRQSVELGAVRFVPVVTGRSIPRLTGPRETARLERWRKIARAAAAQCRRAVLPLVEPVHNFERALELVSNHGALVPWEEERAYGFLQLLRQPPPGDRAVVIFIGPEGGFSRTEIEALTAAGARTLHLGPRILRVETAAAVALGLVQAAWGDMGMGER